MDIFQVISPSHRYGKHGGICLYVEDDLVEDLKEVNYINDDVIFVTLNTIPNVFTWLLPPPCGDNNNSNGELLEDICMDFCAAK